MQVLALLSAFTYALVWIHHHNYEIDSSYATIVLVTHTIDTSLINIIITTFQSIAGICKYWPSKAQSTPATSQWQQSSAVCSDTTRPTVMWILCVVNSCECCFTSIGMYSYKLCSYTDLWHNINNVFAIVSLWSLILIYWKWLIRTMTERIVRWPYTGTCELPCGFYHRRLDSMACKTAMNVISRCCNT